MVSQMKDPDSVKPSGQNSVIIEVGGRTMKREAPWKAFGKGALVAAVAHVLAWAVTAAVHEMFYLFGHVSMQIIFEMVAH
jgi:hypothetical protein